MLSAESLRETLLRIRGEFMLSAESPAGDTAKNQGRIHVLSRVSRSGLCVCNISLRPSS